MKKDTRLISKHITGAKNGKQVSFNFLLDQFWSNVYYYLVKKTKNDNDAEDIAIQAFSKAFEKIESFNEEYHFKTWLIAISKNVYLDFLRKEKATISITEEKEEEAYDIIDDSPSPEDKIITEQNLAKLLKNIKQLKPKYQEVINLRYFQELSYKEIAEVIDAPINNVKVKILRAKKLLAEIIKSTT